MTYDPAKLVTYMDQARSFATRSKDPSTQVGALLLGPGYEVRSSGWNGAPRGSKADEDERLQRPEKYLWLVHAEANAIYNAARSGTPLHGSALVVTHLPCMNCAVALVQVGVVHVVAPTPAAEFADRWMEHLVRTKRLFEECGVRLDLVERL